MVAGPKVIWQDVRDLAREIDAAAARNEATAQDGERLARLVLEFDRGMVGNLRITKPGDPPAKAG